MNKGSKFRSSITYLFAGKVLSNIVSIGGAFFYIRLYNPSTVGVWSSFLSLLALINTFSLFKSEFFLPSRSIYGSKRSVYKFCGESFAFAAVPLSIVAPIFAYTHLENLTLFHSVNNLVFVYIGFLIILEAFILIGKSILAASLHFRIVSLIETTRIITFWIITIVLGFLSSSIFSILSAHFCSVILSALLMLTINHGCKRRIWYTIFIGFKK